MSFLDIFGEVIEALADAGKQPQKSVPKTQPAKQIPTSQVVTLLKQGRRSEAAKLVSQSMNWTMSRAEKFVDEIDTTTTTSSKSFYAKPTKQSTHIDSVVVAHQQAESGAGSNNLFTYLFKKRS